MALYQASGAEHVENTQDSTFSTFSTFGDSGDMRRQKSTSGDIEATFGPDLATSGDIWRHLATVSPPNSTSKVPGMKELILEFIELNQGSFTSQDVDNYLGITSRKDKQYRNKIINNILKERTRITSDKRRSGVYHILKNDIDWIDLTKTSEEPFDITFPLGINELVNLPPRSIVIIAGSKGSGKTSLALSILTANLNKDYGKLYLMSEMGATEYKRRIISMGEDIENWQNNIKAAPISVGFNGPIAKFNKDGLNVIDFLEEVNGEYYRIASDIRDIYDALDNGIAVITIQKNAGQRWAKGGEATREKARLYMTLDVLCYGTNCNVTKATIEDAKDYPEENPHGKEAHILITRGSSITMLKEWQWMKQDHRDYLKEIYEKKYGRMR